MAGCLRERDSVARTVCAKSDERRGLGRRKFCVLCRAELCRFHVTSSPCKLLATWPSPGDFWSRANPCGSATYPDLRRVRARPHCVHYVNKFTPSTRQPVKPVTPRVLLLGSSNTRGATVGIKEDIKSVGAFGVTVSPDVTVVSDRYGGFVTPLAPSLTPFRPWAARSLPFSAHAVASARAPEGAAVCVIMRPCARLARTLAPDSCDTRHAARAMY